MDYKDDMQIDDNALLWECERQAHLFHQVASDYADAQYEQERAKINLERVRAEVDFNIRDNPGNFHLDTEKKPTETAITNKVIEDKYYQQAGDSLVEANHLVRTLGVAKDSLGHKKSMLEVSAKLAMADWSAEPSASIQTRDDLIAKGQAAQRESLPQRPMKLGRAGKQ